MREFLSSLLVTITAALLLPTKPAPPTPVPQIGSDAPLPATVAPVATPDDQAVAILTPEPAELYVPVPIDEQPSQQSLPTLAEQMLAESNRLRSLAGKPPQTLDPRLTSAAQEWVDFLVRYGQYSHYVNGDSRQGNPRTRARSHGFPATDSAYSVSENITVNCQTVDEAFVDWRNSAPHYKAIVGDFDLAGFAMAEGGPWPYRNIWCAVYGKESPATSPKLVSATPVRSAPLAQFQQCQPGMPCYQPARQLQPVYRQPQQTYRTYSQCSAGNCGRRGIFGGRR